MPSLVVMILRKIFKYFTMYKIFKIPRLYRIFDFEYSKQFETMYIRIVKI